MKVYISGPMTGYEDLNFPNFNKMANKLRLQNYDVVNPTEINFIGNDSWIGWMKGDLKAMMECDTIVLLDDWEKSKGATIEVYLGIALGMDFYNEDMESINVKEILNKNILLDFIR
jgi:hypothetical protein